ncbi:MAG: JAB domain-containing protein [Bacilli bacterium]
MGKIDDILLPREKANILGIESLSDSELIAILLNTGSRNENVLELSNRLLVERNGLLGLFQSSKEQLSLFGIKDAKAYRILTVCEILRRLPSLKQLKAETCEEVLKATDIFFVGQKTEVAILVFLSRDKTIMSIKSITEHQEDRVSLNLKDALEKAKKYGSRWLVAVHNHPSGNVNPSEEDLESIKKMDTLCSLYFLALYDFIIRSDDEYYSMRESGGKKIRKKLIKKQ